MNMAVTKFQPLKGATYIPLSNYINAKKAVISVQNKDKCFMWAVLSASHPANNHVDRASKCEGYQNELTFEGIEFSVSAKDYPNFERQNKIKTNVCPLWYRRCTR